MKVFKKIMNAVAAVENCILVVSTLLILVLTVGNVFSRKVIHRSWSFTEELVVAVFVLITLMAAALACREGELVNLSLVTDRLPEKLKKPSVILTTVLCIIFTAILFWFADTGRSCWGRGQQDTSAAQGTKWTLGIATRLSAAASFFPFRLPHWNR